MESTLSLALIITLNSIGDLLSRRLLAMGNQINS